MHIWDIRPHSVIPPTPIEMPTFCGGTKLLRNPLVHDLMEKNIGRLCRFKKSPSYIMKEMDAKN